MKKIMYSIPMLLLLCVCGLLIASLQFGGTPLEGLQHVAGFSSQGIPPTGGSCSSIGQSFPDNPFSGWPLDFRQCNWATISAYFCTPSYPTHRGIDISNDWTPGNQAAIHGAPVLATAHARVAQAVYSAPAQWNYGMGNFIQLVGFEQTCEQSVNLDLNGDNIIGDYCTSVCEEDINQDLNNDGTIGGYCGAESAWKATYMHLLDISVQVDQIVNPGDVIGHVNNTGNSSGDHLHYQINGPDGAIDPGPSLGCPGYTWQ
jgi:murein DD-endopeptidase MepM/ murein hydrolase activator NlpD